MEFGLLSIGCATCVPQLRVHLHWFEPAVFLAETLCSAGLPRRFAHLCELFAARPQQSFREKALSLQRICNIFLDCYWVGSLDFNFFKNKGGFH